eukprot:m51a1_g5348 hypothetical protein (689) ;mRNA; r:456181-458793
MQFCVRCVDARKWTLRRQVACAICAIPLLFIAVIAGSAGIYMSGLNGIERDMSRRDVDRLMSALLYRLNSAHGILHQYATWDDTASVVAELLRVPEEQSALVGPWVSNNFFQASSNGSQQCWRFEFELLAIYPTAANATEPLLARYYPHSSADRSICSSVNTQLPLFFANMSGPVRELLPRSQGVVLVRGLGPFIVVAEPVAWTDRSSPGPPQASMLWAVPLSKVVAKLADAVPACVSVFDSHYPAGLRGSPLPADEYSGWPGEVALERTLSSSAESSRRRHALCSGCPAIRTSGGARYTTSAWAMLGSGLAVRADRPRVVMAAGSKVVVPVFAAVVVSTVGMSVTYYVIMELFVLRRIEAFSKFLADQATRETLQMQQQATDTLRVLHNVGPTDSPEPVEGEMVPLSVEEAGGAKHGGTWGRGNEIARLGGALKANVKSLLSAIERASIARQRQRHENNLLYLSVSLLNVLSEDSALNKLLVPPEDESLDYALAPTMDLFMENPLALQLLLRYCARESSLENVLFLMDCAWLRVLIAESRRNDRLRPVVPTAVEHLRAAYFGDSGPSLNVSARSRRAALAGSSDSNCDAYGASDFDSAEREVFQTVRMDVLGRFVGSGAYRMVAPLNSIERRTVDETQKLPRILEALLRCPRALRAARAMPAIPATPTASKSSGGSGAPPARSPRPK